VGHAPARAPDIAGEVRGALVTMGFSRGEARAAVDVALARVGPQHEHEPLLRAALRAAAS
jgi:Holliday junction resolvasome RuvABC DNA-binding subunit